MPIVLPLCIHIEKYVTWKYFPLQISSSGHTFFGYKIDEDGKCRLSISNSGVASGQRTLASCLVKSIRNSQGTNKAKAKEIFMRDLKRAREMKKGEDLKEVLQFLIEILNI